LCLLPLAGCSYYPPSALVVGMALLVGGHLWLGRQTDLERGALSSSSRGVGSSMRLTCFSINPAHACQAMPAPHLLHLTAVATLVGMATACHCVPLPSSRHPPRNGTVLKRLAFRCPEAGARSGCCFAISFPVAARCWAVRTLGRLLPARSAVCVRVAPYLVLFLFAINKGGAVCCLVWRGELSSFERLPPPAVG
jgi:hypothetical protein